MISDVANWILTNIVYNSRVFTSLLALIILVVAGFLMSEKPIKKISSKRILGAVLFVFAIFIFLYVNIADLADVFTVWATLVLAGVAVFSFEESRRLREENRQREERERKERSKERILKELDKISEWAQNLVDFAIDRDDNPHSIKELKKHLITGGSIKRQYSGFFSTIVDTQEMRDIFNTIDELKAFLNTQPNNIDGYTKATEFENRLHKSAEDILIKTDNARSLLLR